MHHRLVCFFIGNLIFTTTCSGLLNSSTTSVSPRTTTSSDEDSSEEIDWQCGTDFISKLMSEGQIEIDCPTLKVPINNCCIVHDDCYDKQRGQKFCDDHFCECLQTATVSSAICHKEDGPLFCSLVRQLGDDAYRASGNTSTTTASTARSPTVASTTAPIPPRPLPGGVHPIAPLIGLPSQSGNIHAGREVLVSHNAHHSGHGLADVETLASAMAIPIFGLETNYMSPLDLH